MTLFLRFPDEVTAQACLSDFHDADNGWHTASLVHALDPIGTLYDATSAPLPGWHVNFIGTLPDAALTYVITPLNPRVVFAS